jgi:hypothetical protein
MVVAIVICCINNSMEHGYYKSQHKDSQKMPQKRGVVRLTRIPTAMLSAADWHQLQHAGHLTRLVICAALWCPLSGLETL